MSGRYYFFKTKMLGGIFKDSEDILSKIYNNSGDADKILINYLLVIKSKKPIENTGYLNYKIKKYEDLLDYLEKEKYKSKTNLVIRTILVIGLTAALLYFYDEEFYIKDCFFHLSSIAILENVLISISPFKINILILGVLFVLRLVFFLGEKEIKKKYKSFLLKSKFSKTLE